MIDPRDISSMSAGEIKKAASKTASRSDISEIEALEKLLKSGTLSAGRLRDVQHRLFELKGVHVDEDNDD